MYCYSSSEVVGEIIPRLWSYSDRAEPIRVEEETDQASHKPTRGPGAESGEDSSEACRYVRGGRAVARAGERVYYEEVKVTRPWGRVVQRVA
jgi:hypothetical protein